MFSRKHRSKGEGPQEVNISLLVTPFLDMSFQILAFFIFTFRPTPQEGGMPFLLPAKADSGNPKPEKASDEPLDVPTDLTVLVDSKAGGIDGLTLQTAPEGKRPKNEVINGGIDGLYKHLKAMRPSIDAKQSVVKVQSSGVLQYQNLVQLMDKIRLAGFQPGFEAPTEYGAGKKEGAAPAPGG
jgi:biopolymer transport protein ExbD